jgi:hypothetical protein
MVENVEAGRWLTVGFVFWKNELSRQCVAQRQFLFGRRVLAQKSTLGFTSSRY